MSRTGWAAGAYPCTQGVERAEITFSRRARTRFGLGAGHLLEQIAGGARHRLRGQPDTLEQLKDARVFMAAGIARLAAERATPTDIARPHERLAEHRASLVDLDDFVRRGMAVHCEIAGISGNPIFPALVEDLFGWPSGYHQPAVRARSRNADAGQARLQYRRHRLGQAANGRARGARAPDAGQRAEPANGGLAGPDDSHCDGRNLTG